MSRIVNVHRGPDSGPLVTRVVWNEEVRKGAIRTGRLLGQRLIRRAGWRAEDGPSRECLISAHERARVGLGYVLERSTELFSARGDDEVAACIVCSKLLKVRKGRVSEVGEVERDEDGMKGYTLVYRFDE